MLPESLQSAVENAKVALQNNPQNHLDLNERIKLWQLFGEGRSMDEDYDTYKTGHLRRTVLQLLCVKKVLPLWEKAKPGDRTVSKVIQKIEEFIQLGKPEDYIDEQYPLLDEVLLCAQNYTETDSVGLVAWAASSALDIAISDTDIWDEEDAETLSDTDDDVYGWEADFCACIAYTGGLPEDKKADKDKRFGFWMWYLDEAVDNAYNIPI